MMWPYIGFFGLIIISVSWLVYEWIVLGRTEKRYNEQERLMRELRRKRDEG